MRITIVILFSLLTISLAADVTVYHTTDYGLQNTEPAAVSQFPWKFGFFGINMFYVYLYIKNKSSKVTAINITYQLDDRTFEMKKATLRSGPRKGQEFYFVPANTFLKTTEIEIRLNLFVSNMLCSSLLVAQGRTDENITNELLEKEFPYYHGCRLSGCVLLVDLINKCDGPPLVTETKVTTTTENAGTDGETINLNNTFTFNSSTNLEITTHKNSANDTKNSEHQTSPNIVLIYVIPSVIGICVIILLIYLIRVKKYCHRNSDPVETIELNTHSTANDVVYADLGSMHGDSQPPRRDEGSPYAQIIGGLKPAD